MHEDDTQERSRLKERSNSVAKSSSNKTIENEERLMGSMRSNNSTAVEKPSVRGDGTHSNISRRGLFVIFYVVTTCLIAGLFYYLGTLQVHQLGKVARPQIIVETLWATPLARTHLRTHPRALNLSAFNTRLAEAVAEDYTAFRANYSNHDGSDVNDLFFEHQVGSIGEKSEVVRARIAGLQHRKLAEFRVVARCAANLAEGLLRKFGKAAVEGSAKRLQAWATLHDSSSRHALHVHTESTLSIVYYVRMGEGAPLRLYDPRGPRPPFEGSVEVWPEEGEMIGFPGWVAHEVETGSGQRISLVFNVPGNWEGDEFGGETIGLGRWSKVKGWKLDFGDGVL